MILFGSYTKLIDLFQIEILLSRLGLNLYLGSAFYNETPRGDNPVPLPGLGLGSGFFDGCHLVGGSVSVIRL